MLAAMPASAENLRVIDRRGDTAQEGHYAMFCLHVAESTQTLVALCTGDSPETMEVETAFGLTLKESGQVASAVSAEAVAKLRTVSGESETQTLIVRIDSEQYAAALKEIEYWTESEGFIDPPETVNLNMASKIVKTIGGLKAPYRSRRTDSIQYFEDLWTLNR